MCLLSLQEMYLIEKKVGDFYIDLRKSNTFNSHFDLLEWNPSQLELKLGFATLEKYIRRQQAQYRLSVITACKYYSCWD